MTKIEKMNRADLERLSEVRQKVMDLIDNPNISKEAIAVILDNIHDKIILIILNNL